MMKIALLVVFALGVVAYVVFGLLRKERDGVVKEDDKRADPQKNENALVGAGFNARPDCNQGGVCGVSCFCDDEGLRRQMSEEIVYFEDEELDAFRGVDADAYTEEQTEAFAEVLTTLQPQEVADWLHSLQLRGIALPLSLKEEAIMMMEG